MNLLLPALIETCCLLLLAFSIIGFFAQFNWIIDLINHTRPYLFLAAVVGAIFALLFQQQIGLYAALIACMINGVIVVPYVIPKLQRNPTPDSALTLMTINVLYGNRSPEKLLATIQDVDPDILIVQEMSASNQQKAEKLWELFPHASDQPNNGSREVLVFSKIPLDSVNYILGDKPWRAEAEVQITIDNQPFTVLGIHPKAPMSANRFARRNAELDLIAERVNITDVPIIVAGDMNITPWTPIFRRFLRESNLNDGRKRNGFNFTWAPGSLPKMIPIDHVLYRGVNIHSFTSGPDTGSDHLPIIVEFSLPSKDNRING
ncbi:MAG: endonuclease/exonuclease/phosphatase family protein [Anaerolineae bacterium]